MTDFNKIRLNVKKSVINVDNFIFINIYILIIDHKRFEYLCHAKIFIFNGYLIAWYTV